MAELAHVLRLANRQRSGLLRCLRTQRKLKFLRSSIAPGQRAKLALNELVRFTRGNGRVREVAPCRVVARLTALLGDARLAFLQCSPLPGLPRDGLLLCCGDPLLGALLPQQCVECSVELNVSGGALAKRLSLCAPPSRAECFVAPWSWAVLTPAPQLDDWTFKSGSLL